MPNKPTPSDNQTYHAGHDQAVQQNAIDITVQAADAREYDHHLHDEGAHANIDDVEFDAMIE